MTASTTEQPTVPQVAVNDIGSAEDFLAAIDETIKYFNDGDIVAGTIVKVDRDEVLLDIGYKTEGVIPSRELSIKHDVDPGEVVSVGDEIEALVLQKEDKEGRLILSKKRAQYERAWGTIEKIKEEDGIVTGTVIEVVKGGLILDIGLRGFLPASLVEMRRVRDLQPYVGKQIEAKIIELDKNRNNVVLSRRAWLEQTQSEVRQTFLQTLQKGQVRSGVVSSIVNFGAFVDLGFVLLCQLVHGRLVAGRRDPQLRRADGVGEVALVGHPGVHRVVDAEVRQDLLGASQVDAHHLGQVFRLELLAGVGEHVGGDQAPGVVQELVAVLAVLLRLPPRERGDHEGHQVRREQGDRSEQARPESDHQQRRQERQHAEPPQHAGGDRPRRARQVGLLGLLQHRHLAPGPNHLVVVHRDARAAAHAAPEPERVSGFDVSDGPTVWAAVLHAVGGAALLAA